MTQPQVVFICKSASEEKQNGLDPYVYELESRGFSARIVFVLDFGYKNINILQDKLSRPEQYSGIIFTSPRCVRAVATAVGPGNNLDEKWKQLIHFAVGETTARLVSDLLKLNTEGANAGNGQKLAPMILSKKVSKPFLLPCGNLKMDSLEKRLAEGEVETECVEVYETVAHPELESNLSAALLEGQPSYFVFFSPSGVRFTYPLLVKSGLEMDKIKWVSIGPTTAAALQSYGLSVHCSSEKPTPECLAETIAATVSSV